MITNLHIVWLQKQKFSYLTGYKSELAGLWNICRNYTTIVKAVVIRTDLCPRFLTLHLKYAVLPIDALTLDCNPLESIEGGSTFCKVDDGTMKAEPATIDGNSSMGEVKGASLEWSETAKKPSLSQFILFFDALLLLEDITQQWEFSFHFASRDFFVAPYQFWIELCQGHKNEINVFVVWYSNTYQHQT